MSVVLEFLGTGAASAPGARAQSCIVLRGAGTTLLLDCGSTALPGLVRALEPADIDGVVVTHLHGDHFGGVPYLVMHQRFAHRTRDLVVAGPPSLEPRLHELSLALYPDFYEQQSPYVLRHASLGSGEIAIGAATVAGHPVTHIAGSDPYGVRVRIGGKLVAYTGDAEWSDALPALADGADLLIAEATTYTSRWAGHLSVDELVARRGELRAPRIVLTHLGPETVARRDAIPFEVADDGATLVLD